ncbi:hypothetical protein [Nocardia arthritidis]|uniref:Uncharacterized protein n=1 Tax=Nocardia arthritidis TaxID=228602 RepID=A0A6G9YLC0_9NOCA|nr:hypothetical protein [Nocardia arthritidis]QIS13998.1 hypothetical protein F5544_30775 [Nocardia arthritidis]
MNKIDNAVLVDSAAGLLSAVASPDTRTITVATTIEGLPTVVLRPGAQLVGRGDAVLRFAAGADGIRLSRDNAVDGLRIEVDPDRRAIYNDTAVADLGRLELADLVVVGQIQILANTMVRAGHIECSCVDVEFADVRGRTECPTSYGVRTRQGAFTIWNQQQGPESLLTTRIRGLSIGRADRPVRGSGVFISGGGDERFGSRGRVEADLVELGEIYIDGGIATGVQDLITSGVFFGYGAHIEYAIDAGSVTTFGVNDMILDAWGVVDRWDVRGPLLSTGSSGNGIINFGHIEHISLTAPIETHGYGARAFNIYSGSVGTIEFQDVTTHGDGAPAIQLSRPLGKLVVNGSIRTHGSSGESLVKGVLTELAANAINVEPGGSIAEILVTGDISSDGDGISTVKIDDGEVWKLAVGGAISALGEESVALEVHASGVPMRDLVITAPNGIGVLMNRASFVSMNNVSITGRDGDLVADGGISVIHSSTTDESSIGGVDGNRFELTIRAGRVIAHTV